jgi:hypothetical protein
MEAARPLAARRVPQVSGAIGPERAAVPLAAGTMIPVYGGFRFQLRRQPGTTPVTGHPSWRLADVSRKMPGEVNRGISNGAMPDEVSDCRSGPPSHAMPGHRRSETSPVMRESRGLGVEMPGHRPDSGEVSQVMVADRIGDPKVLK